MEKEIEEIKKIKEQLNESAKSILDTIKYLERSISIGQYVYGIADLYVCFSKYTTVIGKLEKDLRFLEEMPSENKINDSVYPNLFLGKIQTELDSVNERLGRCRVHWTTLRAKLMGQKEILEHLLKYTQNETK